VKAGLSLVEVLVTLGVLGILLGFGFTLLTPPESRLFTEELKSFLEQSRFEAVKRQYPIAVVWDANTKIFTASVYPSDTTVGCTSSTGAIMVALSSLELAKFPRLSLSKNDLQTGVVWLPNGFLKTCSGTDFSLTLTPFGGIE
jgi:Tfp pilus assembly protein FimT